MTLLLLFQNSEIPIPPEPPVVPPIRIPVISSGQRRPQVTEKIVVLPIRTKIVVENKLLIKGKILANVLLPITKKFHVYFQLSAAGKISSQESIKILGMTSTEITLSAKGTISEIFKLPVFFVVKSTLQKIADLLKIINSVDSIDDFQLTKQSFEFNEIIGAAAPFDSETSEDLEFEHQSTFIGKVTYVPELQTMEIIINGNNYHYCEVPQRIFNLFFEAKSKGEFYNREIKGIYLC